MLDDFTVGRILIRRRLGLWLATAHVKNERAFCLTLDRSKAQGWANRIIRDTGTRTWASAYSPERESMSLCDAEAVR